MSVFYLIAVQQKKFLFLKERFQKQRQMRSRLLMKQDTLVMMMPKLNTDATADDDSSNDVFESDLANIVLCENFIN